jgi:hypothetical protein
MQDLDTRPLDVLERGFAAYVNFACDNPAHFRVMFRPELVSIARHPTCETAAARAYGFLTRGVELLLRDGLVEGDPQTLVALMWSMSHGLSSLLIDGPLAIEIPTAIDRERTVTDVVHAFRLLVERPRA